ncbi:uncharacterized protein LOC114260848 isoform X8 [Camellia sinensis]|uniref:uncharacterized protein LOC114260848 isoform X8 n=1 Tax=Camellia sinensis TaxID=4442 RepID=UPI001035A0E0|nr:uncharacterized protein LOC114260848 isoform X8 [Camellia sinensis]
MYNLGTKQRDDNLGQRVQTVIEKGIPEAMLEKIAKVASQEEERKDFLRKSMFSSLKDRGGEDRVYTAAKGAAFLAHNSFSRISWTRVEDEVFLEDPDALIHVQWEVLKALMILVLSVYDMEDFIRIAYEEELNAERNKFMFDLFRLHKTTNEAILAIARWEMKLDDFILLHEYDVNSLLEQQTTPQDLLIHKDVRVSELLIQCTVIVMKQLRPLKLHKSMKSATFPLRSGVFGNCTEEVIEVVGHADCERRSEGHRFISSHHLLLGLLRTRIGGSVLKFVQLRQALEEPVRNPRYCIYGTAQCLAGVDKIQLEHLFLAIMFLELGRNFFSLRDEIIEIIEQEDLSMDECVLKLGNLCLLEGLKCAPQKDFRSNSLDNNKNAWNAGLSSKRFNVFLEGLLKLTRRQAGKTSEGSVWGFISSVSKFWEPQALKLRV